MGGCAVTREAYVAILNSIFSRVRRSRGAFMCVCVRTSAIFGNVKDFLPGNDFSFGLIVFRFLFFLFYVFNTIVFIRCLAVTEA